MLSAEPWLRVDWLAISKASSVRPSKPGPKRIWTVEGSVGHWPKSRAPVVVVEVVEVEEVLAGGGAATADVAGGAAAEEELNEVTVALCWAASHASE